MNSISRWSDIPEFADEAAEARYWESHELDGRLMATSVHESDSRDSTTITLRFDPRMLSRIKRMARELFRRERATLPALERSVQSMGMQRGHEDIAVVNSTRLPQRWQVLEWHTAPAPD